MVERNPRNSESEFFPDEQTSLARSPQIEIKILVTGQRSEKVSTILQHRYKQSLHTAVWQSTPTLEDHPVEPMS